MGCHPINQKVSGLIPGQGTYPGCVYSHIESYSVSLVESSGICLSISTQVMPSQKSGAMPWDSLVQSFRMIKQLAREVALESGLFFSRSKDVRRWGF